MKKIICYGIMVLSLCSCSKENEQGMDSECGRIMLIDEGAYNDVTYPSALFLDSLLLDGDCLSMTIGYSGCNDGHDMDLITDGSVAESFPVQIYFKIRDNNPQLCEAFFTEKYYFDLSPMRDHLQNEPMARIIFVDQNNEILWVR